MGTEQTGANETREDASDEMVHIPEWMTMEWRMGARPGGAAATCTGQTNPVPTEEQKTATRTLSILHSQPGGGSNPRLQHSDARSLASQEAPRLDLGSGATGRQALALVQAQAQAQAPLRHWRRQKV